jgi:hypothetical protein
MADRTRSTTSITRRHALRLLGGGALVAVAAAGRPRGTDAARTWCRTDPVVKIDGKVADIWLSSYRELHGSASGPAEIVVSVPVGVSTELLASDLGFGRHGYRVSFTQSGSLKKLPTRCQVQVSVYVPSTDGSLPLQVDFLPRSSGLTAASASGSVNKWVKLATS